MKRTTIGIALVATALLSSGCEGFFSLLPSTNQTSVRLINNGSFPVNVTLYVHSDQNVLKAIMPSVGERIEITVPANSTRLITRDCDDLQAVLVDEAEVSIIGDIGPSTDSDVFRDGSDFGCGDVFALTFVYPVVPVSLSIEAAVE